MLCKNLNNLKDADLEIEAKSGEVVSDAIDAGLKIAAETKDVNVPEVIVPEVSVHDFSGHWVINRKFITPEF